MWQEEVQAGTLHIFLEGAEKLPNHQKIPPAPLERALKPQQGLYTPCWRRAQPIQQFPAASGIRRDLFTRTKNDPGAPSPGKAAGEEGPAVPVGPEQQVPSVSVSPAGMGHVLPAPALSQKHSRSCPCSWSCWPLAWPMPYKGQGARAMLVTVPLSQERLSPPPWSPKLERSKARALPGRRRVQIRAGGAARDPGESGPRGISCPGNTEQTNAHCRAWKASTARAGMRDRGTPKVWGAECDSRAVQGQVLYHPCSCLLNSKGAWNAAAPPGDGSTVPMAPLEGSLRCLWDSAQGWRGGQSSVKDVLVSQHSPSNALSRICCPGRWWQVGTSLSSPSGTWLWHRSLR